MTPYGMGWGDLDADDKAANEAAVVDGSRILSGYTFPAGNVWIITEAKDDAGARHVTTLFLPSDH